MRFVLQMWFQSLVLVAMAAPVPAGAMPPDYLPIFEAAYESSFAAISDEPHVAGRIAETGNDVLFRIWKGEGSDFLSGHFRASSRDCRVRGIHFCFESAYMTFAVPGADAKANWSWRYGRDEFSLVSRRKMLFRGHSFNTVLIRRFDREFGTNAGYFVYSYEIGLIAFAEFRAEEIRPAEKRMPDILEHAMILGSLDGLGGRENCKYWACGAMPAAK
ncbi:MAG: hypothetical protein K8S25_02045 [Alphaproteobacteria bacterium]|nr:hypothetical protein [Alphaproteobacteria bacterium]